MIFTLFSKITLYQGIKFDKCVALFIFNLGYIEFSELGILMNY